MSFFSLQLFNTLARLPQISVKMKVRGVWAENESGQKETKAISTAQTEGLVRNWVQVHADQEYVIVIEIAKDSLGFKVRASLCYLFSFLPSSFHPRLPAPVNFSFPKTTKERTIFLVFVLMRQK